MNLGSMPLIKKTVLYCHDDDDCYSVFSHVMRQRSVEGFTPLDQKVTALPTQTSCSMFMPKNYTDVL